MYRFQRSSGPGGRLFLSGTRQGEDNDRMSVRSGSLAANDHDDADLHQVLTHRRLTTETTASGQDSTRVERRGKIKSVTTRVVKKTTTVTRGDQRMVAEAILKTSDAHEEDINNVTPQSGWHSRSNIKRPKMQAVRFIEGLREGQAGAPRPDRGRLTPDTRRRRVLPHFTIVSTLAPLRARHAKPVSFEVHMSNRFISMSTLGAP